MCIYTFFLRIHTPASIQITTGPQNATVFEGESVLFRCSYTGTDSLPYWRIAGTTYSANRLPREYISTADGIFITSVETSMNNTKYICFFTIYVGGGQFVNLESLPAYLLVLKYSKFMGIVSSHCLILYAVKTSLYKDILYYLKLFFVLNRSIYYI